MITPVIVYFSKIMIQLHRSIAHDVRFRCSQCDIRLYCLVRFGLRLVQKKVSQLLYYIFAVVCMVITPYISSFPALEGVDNFTYKRVQELPDLVPPFIGFVPVAKQGLKSTIIDLGSMWLRQQCLAEN